MINRTINNIFNIVSKRKDIKDNRIPYTNRELSWLKFNDRVLEQAGNMNVPICERLFFLSVFQSNLEEFFMIRVGSLQDQVLLEKEIRENKTNMTPKEQIERILEETRRLCRKRDSIYNGITEELRKYGINLVDFANIKPESKELLEKYFREEILPVLSPMIVGRKQPFPFLKNKDLYGVVILETLKGKEKTGIVSCAAQNKKRLIPVPLMEDTYILSEDLIINFVEIIFEKYNIISKSLIKLTRNADIDAVLGEDEELDYREMMQELMKMRKKLSPVKLEMSLQVPIPVLQTIISNIGIKKSQVFYSESSLDFGFINEVRDMLRDSQELFFKKHFPVWPENIKRETSILKQIKEKDFLLFYPYDSMKPFFEMLEEASVNPEVVSIKITLYRLAKHSKVIEKLIEAAENGKEVIVIVELLARFDEENNIEYSRRLEEAGCLVVYGIEGVKIHSKLCLITKRLENRVEYFVQIGTGNYNETTSSQYTDMSLLTADYTIGREAAEIFKSILLGEYPQNVEKFMVAPDFMQNRILEYIDNEIVKVKNGKQGYIGVKINSLTDIDIINKLIEASKNGVKVHLIVRGACCLVPGIKGKTDNIRIVSIVGRFLEHSRIYIFGAENDDRIYISSADWMTRNTLRRIETAVLIQDTNIKKRIRDVFNTLLKDNTNLWEQNSDGEYLRKSITREKFNSQESFL